MADYHNKLQRLEKLVEDCIRALDDDEQIYRDAGVNYHRLRITTRRTPTSHISLDDIETLRSRFEISTANEWDTQHQLYREVLNFLNEARAQIVLNGTEEELKQRCEAAASNLSSALTLRESRLPALMESSNIIGELHQLEEDVYAYSKWWANDYFEEMTEWDIFVNWVQLFPETEKLMKAGRTLDDVATDVLCQPNPEGFD